MSLYYQDDQTVLHHGDAASVLATLPDGSADCIVTSPPYFGLRDYGVDGQIGAESSPAEFVSALVAVFREARRVLADDGTLWLNLGDSYYSGRGAPTGVDAKNPARRFGVRAVDKGGVDWAKPKNLLGIPWRVAFALQDDGWILRNDIIWEKPNAMPESVADRLSNRHEHLFLFTKSPRYWFNLTPIREPLAESTLHAHSGKRSGSASGVNAVAPSRIGGGQDGMKNGKARVERAEALGGKNPGDVWTVATQPFGEAHFATMPPALAERCVMAGCKPHGTVLDPFSGSGTTGYAAAKHNRRYIGIDLNAEYLSLSLRTRLAQPAFTFGGIA